ncbi:MAG: pantoate--beta-alanine ligase [Bacteroidetes bacterium HGW-Bacteroidetes-20]|nr:MAG: pantoate--beta-alanine ligase [Bacteroidetes bacterium HGW-Bacteroidetes-20]
MVLIDNIEKLREVVFRIKSNGKSIGFVPTMGALHAGHLSLIQRAHSETQVVVVSIFVNPIQFNNQEDLSRYPRTLEQDIALIQEYTDIIFTPSIQEMYPSEPTESYHFGEIENVMEGASRPGHFNGVGVVVKRLFDYVTPDKAFFGEKDFQQIAIIRELVKQENIDVTIVPCPIIREKNGLAMSSRNQRLTTEEREIASKVYHILNQSLTINSVSTKPIIDFVTSEILKINEIKIEYFQIVNDLTLQPIDLLENELGAVGCIAFYVGNVRLIDNVRYR